MQILQRPNELTRDSCEEKSPIFFLLFMALVIQILWATQGPVKLHEGGLVDTDSYMRVNRVLHLVESGDWYDSRYPRSNAPYGEVQHWTRAMDGLLIAGATLATPFVSFPTALHWWGALVSPLFHVITLMGLIWLVRPIFNRDQTLIMGGIFVLQPSVIGYYLAGRVDHHGILLCGFIILLGCTLRISLLPRQWKACVVAGVTAGLGIWVSIEFFVALVVSLFFLSCCWVLYGNDWSKRLLLFTMVLWLTGTLALLVEGGVSQFSVVEFDRYSVVHWTIFTILGIVWGVIWVLHGQRYLGVTRFHRLILGGLGCVILASVMGILFPKFFDGPLVNVDPRIMTLLWERVTETQPLISTDPWQFGRFVFRLGIALPGIPYLMWLIWNEKDSQVRCFWVMISIGILVYLPLAVREMRWIPYAEFLFVLPYAHLVHLMVLRVETRVKLPWQSIAKATIVMVGAFGFLVGGATLMAQERSGVGGTTATDCPIKPLSEFLSESTGWGDQRRTIMAFVDFGPELLYRTPHRVIATPYHRNAAGVVDTYDVMSDTTGQQAQSILNARHVNLILLCPSSPSEPGFYMEKNGGKSLYGKLIHGKHPDWMEPVNLPSHLVDQFKLFQVTHHIPSD